MPTERKKRKYNSSRRKEQARETRSKIITAAKELFFENGYSGTSIETIANSAGVAVETIYATFGNKRSILTALVDVSVTGDDLPIPLLERPNIQEAQILDDQRLVIQKFSQDVYAIMQRMDPIFELLRATAKSEPDIQEYLDHLLHGRLQGMQFMLEQLMRIGPLRDNLDLTNAAETIWVISSAEVFHLLITDRGWTEAQYVAWLADTLSRLLLS